MTKYILFTFIGLSWMASVHAQQKFSIEKGQINFASKAQLELIQASSDKVNGLIDLSGKFAFFVAIQSFTGFNSSLQREHFNEKYMESDRFPKATFSGKIIEEIDFTKDGTYDVRAKGDLTIHGVSQTRIIKGKLTIKGETLYIETTFMVPLSDHNITIPQIISQKIATEIEVTFKASMVIRK